MPVSSFTRSMNSFWLSASRTALVAIDAAQVLDTTYKAVGVTLLLVDSHGSVVVSPALRPGFHLEGQLQLLKPTR